MTAPINDVSAVLVDYHAGQTLIDCIKSLHDNGVFDIVVVDNASPGAAKVSLEGLGVRLVQPRINLGYGRGANRGAAVATPAKYLVVSNPDVVVHHGAVRALVSFLDGHPEVGIAGPTIVDPDGAVYPSQRVFPDFWLAGLHALLAPLWPDNPATRRYRSARADGTVDWVSGAFFVIRRDVFEQVGGFDERYFMFAEDMALCWQAREHGWGVAAVPEATVTHIEGVSRRHASRAMVVAHHASALRFEWQTARGVRRALMPLAALVLGLRLVVMLARREGN
ncbi:MAG TPA: glycosyltransferase family 2 protein [Acidimicrobiales bacterium]|nr:glycosyltransferase family 2 protein [Acidimicrobiales bacterium]